ncbi:MAG: endonuclease [Pedobacter sp.]|nr:MAG: endonuclease [Pedobacter sp.]
MPEGPILLILKEEVDALHLIGKKVLRIDGVNKIDADRLIGQPLKDVKTYGKNFLLCFKDFTLRVHLMMFGTYLINEDKATKLQLSLQFDGATINFYTTSLKIIDEDLDDVYDWNTDIMSDRWDAKAALKKMQEKPKSVIADLLLDQDIFTGSGNIIKNEALFRAGIHPMSTVAAIPEKKLKELIKAVRDFSFDFLKWKKGKVLKKHLDVYEQKNKAHPQVTKEYLGKGKRGTYIWPEKQHLYV